MAATYQRVRIACQRDKPSVLIDLTTDGPVELHRARAIRFELASLRDGAIEDISNFASVTVSVKRLEEKEGPALMRKTVVAASFDETSGLTLNEWESESSQHVVAAFPDDDTALPLSGKDRRKFWLSITATTTGGDTLTLAYGEIWMVETGAGDNVADVTDLTALESAVDALEADVAALELVSNSSGTGSPEGVVTRSPGAGYLDTASMVFYIKASGTNTNTGWLPLGGS